MADPRGNDWVATYEAAVRLFELAWPYVSAGAHISASLLASAHAILKKSDIRAAVGWIGAIWLVPLVGPVLYLLFGINRVHRRAVRLRRDLPRVDVPPPERTLTARSTRLEPERLRAIVDRATNRPLLFGNRIEPLLNGDGAYPPMIRAIAQATRTVLLSTYIFDNDTWGMRFVEALAEAKDRGVEVRVLVDAAGVHYSLRPVDRVLQKKGIRTARFMPPSRLWRLPQLNLRTHRKILVVDGRVGFTGGINIRDGHVLEDEPKHPARDVHFRVEGPIVRQLSEVFAEDWAYTTRETLQEDLWFPELEPVGHGKARCITDGPDEDLNRMRLTWLGAIACAQRRIRIVTPYFLPDAPIASSLNMAAMRGVDIQVVIPIRSNIPLVQWAMWGHLWQFAESGVEIWLSDPPFDHSKLMVVDGTWTCIGSANWDPRSLRLNFELCVECYDRSLAEAVHAIIDDKLERAHRLEPRALEKRPLHLKLRDGTARLLTPYL